MTRALESRHDCIALGVLRRARPQINKHPILSVNVGAAWNLTVDGDDAFALLAKRFGDELLEPRAEARDRRRRDQRRFITSLECQSTQKHTELESSVVRPIAGARSRHRFGTIEQNPGIGTDGCSRHKSEIRK